MSAAERMENRGPLRDWDKLLTSLHHLVEDSAPGRNLARAACDRGLGKPGRAIAGDYQRRP